MTRPIGKNRLKREYVRARDFYSPLRRDLHEMLELAQRLPQGICDPAIDVLMDRVDAAEIPYRAALKACCERGIASAYEFRINARELDVDPDHEDAP